MELTELRKMRSKIIEQYYNGKTFEDLIKMYSSKWSHIYDVVAVSFECKYDNLVEFQKEQIIKMYNDGLSTTQIGEKLKIHHKLVSEVLQKNGIKRTGNNQRKYKLNEHYFDIIDTPNKAYILGLFYADGYNSLDKQTIRLQLQYTDKDILEAIRKELDSEKPLKFIKCNDKVASNGFISKDMYQLEFYGKHICKTLEKYGMVQNKSLILEFPMFLDKNLYSHFIRGYFDGDGSLCVYQKKNGKHQPLLTITSTESFCQKCLEILRNEVNVGGGIYDASSHNGITKVISISGFVQLDRLLSWLYEDASLYIKRKYDIYMNQFMNAKYINNSRSA